MAYRLIYSFTIFLQFTIFDIIQKGIQTLEDVDLRTQEGVRRYKQIYGAPPRMNGARHATESEEGGPPAMPSPEMTYLMDEVPERTQRLIGGYFALAHGKGGVQEAARQTGLDPKTVRKGKLEIETRAAPPKGWSRKERSHKERSHKERSHKGRSRRPGGGRRQKGEDPAYRREMEDIVDQNMAGDPTGKAPNWLRKTLRWVQKKLSAKGVTASPSTIRKTLKNDFDVSMKKNRKSKDSRPRHPDREAQFEYIAALKGKSLAEGIPAISVDAKKRELIGNFAAKGETWRKEPYEVMDHDYRSAAAGIFIPYGIYNLRDNAAHFYCGTSAETPEFAVDCIAAWWEEYGQVAFPGVTVLVIFCDGGGGNGSRPYLWKVYLQEKLANRFDLTVTVCHYPPGASKYNPIEHRTFSIVGINQAGEPLTTPEKALAYFQSTTTETGLTVTAKLVDKEYQKGLKASQEDIDALCIEYAEVCPRWNYTISPQA